MVTRVCSKTIMQVSGWVCYCDSMFAIIAHGHWGCILHLLYWMLTSSSQHLLGKVDATESWTGILRIGPEHERESCPNNALFEREFRGWAILRTGMCSRGSDEREFCERECVEEKMINGNSVASMMTSNGNNFYFLPAGLKSGSFVRRVSACIIQGQFTANHTNLHADL